MIWKLISMQKHAHELNNSLIPTLSLSLTKTHTYNLESTKMYFSCQTDKL